MLEKIRKIGEAFKENAERAAILVGDLNGDGKVDEEDARIAAEWAKKTAKSVGAEAAELGRAAVRSDMVKDAAAGAAIGAVVAVPVPLIGPVAGAAIGAGLGVYKNLTKSDIERPKKGETSANKPDLHAELVKLADLRDKAIITEAEFEELKANLLRHNDA